MASYSKNRPAFKSKAEIYKKPKWTKFREKIALHFSNLKRWFAKLSYKINEKGSQRLTIMIVPHSEKKIVNVQISNYILFFTSIVIAVTIVTSVVAISNNQQINKQYVRLKDEDEFKRLQIDNYKSSITSLNKRFTMFKSDINNIMKSTGKEKPIYNDDDIIIGDEYSNNNNKPREVAYLDKIKGELDNTKTELQFLGDFITKNKRLLREMPSSYPLPMRVRINSSFGYRIDPITHQQDFHPGLDLAGIPGSDILAAADGDVVYANYNSGGYGNMVEVRHKYGFVTRYAHMERFGPGIFVGAKVKQGQTIGYVGTTGRSTGYHLHFEIHVGDQVVSPDEYTTMR